MGKYRALSHSVSLNGLLVSLGIPSQDQDKLLTDLTLDSRKLLGGELFLAVPGFSVDGRRFIEAAVASGAGAVLAESEGFDGADRLQSLNSAVPVIFVKGLKDQLGTLASHFYRQPAESLSLIGVTGTNGKTSCCWFIAQLLSQLGKPCAVMGTVGKGVPPEVTPCLNTTSDPISTQAFMRELVSEGVSSLAMEVSSHGLDQGRVEGLTFDVGVYTNLSRDHLDYHKTMDAYAEAKSRLFDGGRVKTAVINRDDQYAQVMIDRCSKATSVITFSTVSPEAEVFAQNITLDQQGVHADLVTPWGEGVLRTPQLGRFNLENLLAVIAAVCVQGHKLSKVLELVAELSTVPGRMQRLGGNDKPLVVVDYAHTPGALSSVLSSLKEHGASRLVCVFGCGGDRDRGKRPLMMEAALSGAEKVVVTSDNPRTEKPEQIIADAMEGVSEGQKSGVTAITDRAEAIEVAIAEAAAGDIVVIAGKGHEDYQEINGQRLSFSDYEQAELALAKWSAGAVVTQIDSGEVV